MPDMDQSLVAEVEASGPRRRCIATRAVAEKSAMIRFVVDGDGVLTPDLKCKLPGRGLWVLAEENAIKTAIERNAFAKAAKTAVQVPVDLLPKVRALAEREVAELIGLAKRSGQLVAGFEKVQAALRHGKVRLLLEACDAARDGREKLARLAGTGVNICAPLPAARLAAAIGRDHAVHAAVMDLRLAQRLAIAIKRLTSLGATEFERIRH